MSQQAQGSTSGTYSGDESIGSFDARVLAKYQDCWVMSPNSLYVPEPFVFEARLMEPLRDGRFGHIDCFQWPQLYSERYMWSGCIPRKVAYQDHSTWRWLWWDIANTPENFVMERGSMFRKNPHYYGPVNVTGWMRLCRRALMCLKQLPFTFRDTILIVALFQCLGLDVFGMLEYLEPTMPPASPLMDAVDRWMGAITTDPEICQRLFDSHIPVWLVWKPNTVPADLKVLRSVEITFPEGIVTEPEVFEVGQTLKWAGGSYLPGDLCHQQTRQSPVIGLEQFAAPPWPDPRAVTPGENFVAARPDATPSTSTSSRTTNPAAAPSNAQSSGSGIIRTERTKQRGGPYPSAVSKQRTKATVTPNAELWQDVDDPTIPPSMYAWHTALQNVIKDPKRVGPNAPKISYFFPHPALFVRGDSSERRLRYLRNWLASRAGWIVRLATADVSPVTPCTWRAFLNMIPEQISSTYSGNKLREAADLFGPELVKVQRETPSHIQFRDVTLSLADLGTIDIAMKGKILWDLYKHNFRFELVTLDRMLVPNLWSSQQLDRLDQVRQIFPGDSELTMYDEPFPRKNEGLGSHEPQTKLEFVERLRALVASWPGFPLDLGQPLLPSASVTRVWAVEKKVALFYVQSFFDYFGRPPIVPRHIPNNARTIYGLDNHIIPSSSSALPPPA
ncbi:hypothetical protein BKA83DRAFT_4498812 [Pisolithus microcarpus]|nr:hypothetical protein BKA83DRAFT_4498812 [Pisolithus microcarpus]